jgi:hypothetical protein
MYYAIVNDENRVKKEFAYNTADYTLLLDHHMNTEKQAWKWEDNPMGDLSKLSVAPNYYDYIITIESDKPVNIFEKHVIAVSTLMDQAENEYYISTGYVLPAASLPLNQMMGTGGATGFYTDMMVSAYAGMSQLAFAVNLNPLSFNTDETFFASMFGHYNQACFTVPATDTFGDEFDNFFHDMKSPLLFSLVNRFPGDNAEMRFSGAGMSLFISTYKEDSNVRIKIYRKTVTAMLEIGGA